MAWMKWFSSLTHPEAEPSAIDGAKDSALQALDDCQGTEAERLRWRLKSAASAHELWLLRSAVFQMVSNQHCQATAAQRVNALMPVFRRLLPKRLVGRV